MGGYNERRLKEAFLKLFSLARKEAPTKPECQHQEFECNGCPLQDMDYAVQSKTKRQFLEDYLGVFGGPVAFHPATHRYRYRNKIELSYIHEKLGFIRKDDHSQSFELHECKISPELINQAANRIQALLKEFPIKSYQLFSHEGNLRYVSFRHARQHNELMISFTTYTKENGKELESIANVLLKEKLVKSVHWLVNDTWSNTSTGVIHKSWGNSTLMDYFAGFTYEIGPLTFFQTNPIMAQEMVTELLRHIPENKVVLDAYCGVGTLSLPLAKVSKQVLGVEEVESSIDAARENATRNKVNNAVFACAKVEDAINELPEQPEVVVLDPPRSGLHPKVVKALNKQLPPVICYVSCNPFTLRRDLEGLADYYDVKQVYGFDFFPHTPHIETLAVLKLKEGV